MEHLHPLFERGDLVLLPFPLARQMDAYLQKLPWVGQSIDLAQLKDAKRISTVSRESVAEGLKETAFAAHAYALAFFSGSDPVIGGKLEVIVQNIDTIFWKAPGTRFVFGAEMEAAEWEPALDHFIQYDGGDFLILSC